MRRAALWIGLAIVACSSAPPQREAPVTSTPVASTPSVEPQPAASVLTPWVEPDRPAKPDELPPGSDHRSAAACSSDAECGWDDPCAPERCVGAIVHDQKCSETAPAPGTCSCVDALCTLKPTTPPKPEGTCEPRGCVVDRAGGRCVADVSAEHHRSPVSLGPSCDCVDADQGCLYRWHEAVACKSDLDCWIEELPRRHLVRRPARLRRPFRFCEDGEVLPVCREGVCAFGAHWKC